MKPKKKYLHYCTPPQLDPPEGVMTIILKWRCSHCGQVWLVNNRVGSWDAKRIRYWGINFRYWRWVRSLEL